MLNWTHGSKKTIKPVSEERVFGSVGINELMAEPSEAKQVVNKL